MGFSCSIQCRAIRVRSGTDSIVNRVASAHISSAHAADQLRSHGCSIRAVRFFETADMTNVERCSTGFNCRERTRYHARHQNESRRIVCVAETAVRSREIMGETDTWVKVVVMIRKNKRCRLGLAAASDQVTLTKADIIPQPGPGPW